MEKILKNRENFLKIIFFREINVKRFCVKTLSAWGKMNLEGWGGVGGMIEIHNIYPCLILAMLTSGDSQCV